MKRILILLFLTSLLFAENVVVYNEDGTLTCNTAGIAYISSTQAYGEWEFDVNKGGANNQLDIHFISSTISGSNNYIFRISDDERIYLREDVTPLNKFYTAASYISINTDYRIKVTRSLAGVFTVYIKGGSAGWDDWTTVSVAAGTNPTTDNTHTTSNYFVTDLDPNDTISNIHLTDDNLDVRDFTVSTGAYSTSGTWFEEIPSYLHSPDLTNCVAYYPLSSYWADGASISDVSGNNNTGTSANTPIFVADQNGVSNQAMSFDGSSDYVSISDSDFPSGNSDRTISVWAKSDDVSLSGKRICGYGVYSAHDTFDLEIHDSKFNIIGHTTNFNGIIPLQDNTKYYLVVVIDGDKLSTYINGVVDVDGEDSSALTTILSGTAYIGRGASNVKFNGSLSDIAIYSEAKSATWVAAQYTAGQYTAPIKSGN